LAARYCFFAANPGNHQSFFTICYARVTPDDIRNAARKYLVDQCRTIVTLTSGGAK
jgi:hypothetical protein